MKPFEECPQFDICSCNDCPLDPEHLEALPGEEKCNAQRRTREAIAARYPEVGDGLTHRERMRDKRSAAAKERWEALSQVERDARTARLAQSRFSQPRVKKGGRLG